METWKIQALLAALFAGLTSILAKSGMKHLSADLSLAIRTCVVATLVILNALFWTSGRPAAALAEARPRDLALLALSGLTTTLSWIFYYRAMKTGTVSFVSLVDKGSILVTLILSFWLLKEPLTIKTFVGSTLIIAGLITLTYKA